MIKNVKWFFVVLLIVFSSPISLSFQSERIPTERLVSGDKIPVLRLCDSVQPLNLHIPQDGYTLLSFWASYDAASREKNAALLHEASKYANVKVVSVSFDCYASVFRAAIKQDKLNERDCFVETEGFNSEVFRDFDLKEGFVNYLIDADGIIVGKNISASDLVSFLN